MPRRGRAGLGLRAVTAVLLAAGLAACTAEKPAPAGGQPEHSGPFARLIQVFLADEAEKEQARERRRAEAAARRPAYIVIRYDRPHVVYEDALYVALTKALDRYPEAEFDLVLAIPTMPTRANPREALARGERQIEDVVLAMTDMGMPAGRLTISAHTDETVTDNEIRIYIR